MPPTKRPSSCPDRLIESGRAFTLGAAAAEGRLTICEQQPFEVGKGVGSGPAAFSAQLDLQAAIAEQGR